MLLVTGCGTGDDSGCVRRPTTTTSGVRYQDLVCGRGAEAARGDLVTVSYTAELADGTPLPAQGSGPLSFPLGMGQVIAGWDDGIPSMRVGGERRLTVPPELAFGDGGFGAMVPPDATLVFDIRLERLQAEH
jgi:peptidylprolyl isomerase